MKVPHTVPANTLRAYQPSSQTLELMGERGRQLRAENFRWDNDAVPSLIEKCLDLYADDFPEQQKVLTFLEPDNFLALLEKLPTSLPLLIVIPLIEDGVYWMRRCLDTWTINNNVAMYDNSWKRMFTERYIQDLIENEEPGYTDWFEVEQLLKLCCPYVKRLLVTQLQPPRLMEFGPEPPELYFKKPNALKSKLPTRETIVYSNRPVSSKEPGPLLHAVATDNSEIQLQLPIVKSPAEDLQIPHHSEVFVPQHLDLSPFLIFLENLQEFSLQFGIKNIGMDFAFQYFGVHMNDIVLLGNGLRNARRLKVLRILCSDINDDKLIVILKSLELCPDFSDLEISHCKISNTGAKAMGHFMSNKPSLKHVKLRDNYITYQGIECLAHALTLEDTKVETFDLKFNFIGEIGGRYLATALAKSKRLLNLFVSGCGLGRDFGKDLAQALQLPNSLQSLDISNNSLGNDAGLLILDSIQDNWSILKIDTRHCAFNEQCEHEIQCITTRNREKIRKGGHIEKRSFRTSPLGMDWCPQSFIKLL